MDSSIQNKLKGCIYGQAIGDALGLGTEFMNREEVCRNYPYGLERYDQIIKDEHRDRWDTGSWTDDTDMMICIAKTRKNNHFDIQEIAQNFKDWYKGFPLGIGRNVLEVLSIADYVRNPLKTSKLIWKLNGCESAGNGGLMRTSILGTSPLVENKEIEEVCCLTHYDPRCVGSCVIVTKVIQRLIFQDEIMSKEEMIKIAKNYDKRIVDAIENSFCEDLSELDLCGRDMGYTLKTFSVALWCLWNATDFKDGLLKVVNQGGDADTNGATACAVLGAKFGFSDIPEYYSRELHDNYVIEDIYQDSIKDLSKI